MAAGNLSACLAVTLAYEGGLSMIRSDPGNWTGGRVGVGAVNPTISGTGIFATAGAANDDIDLTGVYANAEI